MPDRKILPEPCTKEWEHHPHPVSFVPFHNLGNPLTLACPGFRATVTSPESSGGAGRG